METDKAVRLVDVKDPAGNVLWLTHDTGTPWADRVVAACFGPNGYRFPPPPHLFIRFIRRCTRKRVLSLKQIRTTSTCGVSVISQFPIKRAGAASGKPPQPATSTTFLRTGSDGMMLFRPARQTNSCIPAKSDHAGKIQKIFGAIEMMNKNRETKIWSQTMLAANYGAAR